MVFKLINIINEPGNYNESIEQKIKLFNITKVLQKPCSLIQLKQVLEDSWNRILDPYYI